MPYGLPKKLASETNNNWMYDCVSGVLMRGKGINEAEAIILCKSKLIAKNGNRNRANIAVINKLLDQYSEERKKK